MRARLAALVASISLLPSLAFAFPFGGQIHQIIFCYNNAIYVNLGPPRGGPFVWTPSTRTYRFGPPLHTGQWLLGLAAPPYYCVVSRQPIIVWSGILMTMEGSSGAPAPAYQPGSGSDVGGSDVNGPNTAWAGVSHLLVSEVYPEADAAHGGDAAHEWIELFNPTAATATLSHWVMKTSDSSFTIPTSTVLAPHAYLIVTAATDTRARWLIPTSSPVLIDSSSFGAGLASAGDFVKLLTNTGITVDEVSWGTSTEAFSPSAPAPAIGHSLIRTSLSRDTDKASDWADTSAPNPGR